MKKTSPEVLIYIQNVKSYFDTNKEAREYFLKNSDEKLFFKHMTEIAEKNYQKNGEAILDREQFESLRKTVNDLSSKTKKEKVEINNQEKIFVDFPNFGFICLN